ncbi:MAG: DUF5060 domain-containing protein [Acidobacteriota bacterium]|nr:DUF5060 domain-containing protein [Acidobacteriota bacterium]
MLRRDVLRLGAASVAASLSSATLHASIDANKAASHPSPPSTVEMWGCMELPLQGPSEGNPFREVTLTAEFQLEHRTVQVTGFYDGEGRYLVRFMPDQPGRWSYRTASNRPALDGHTGSFACVPATSPGNHGPVTTARQFHFQYADGTRYLPMGTTNYAYLFTTEDNAALVLQGIAKAKFNKTRICLLPKPLGADTSQQILPFPRQGEGNDLTRFHVAYFQQAERRLLALQQAGIEADLILFHPYDAWGYKAMGAEADEFYLRYAVARLAAYRNVWWSVANEYDLVKNKTMADWDRAFRILVAADPYGHLRSIHHSGPIYDNTRSWVTHASLQRYDFEKTAERRDAWRKPILYDELQYEGDIDRRWGNLSAEEMTRRFWLATVHGAYASHGEVFMAHHGEASWSDAGALRGDAAPRLAFLRDTLQRFVRTGLAEVENSYYLCATESNDLLLYYFDYHRPARYDFPLPTTGNYQASLVDPWQMTTTELPGTFSGKSRIALPGRPYLAVLFHKVSDNHDPHTEAAKPEVLD